METGDGIIYLPPPNSIGTSLDIAKSDERWNTALFLGVVLGSMLTLAAVFASFLSWVNNRSEEPARTVITVITLLSLVFVSHCLDKLKDVEIRMRQERHQ